MKKYIDLLLLKEIDLFSKLVALFVIFGPLFQKDIIVNILGLLVYIVTVLNYKTAIDEAVERKKYFTIFENFTNKELGLTNVGYYSSKKISNREITDILNKEKAKRFDELNSLKLYNFFQHESFCKKERAVVASSLDEAIEILIDCLQNYYYGTQGTFLYNRKPRLDINELPAYYCLDDKSLHISIFIKNGEHIETYEYSFLLIEIYEIEKGVVI